MERESKPTLLPPLSTTCVIVLNPFLRHRTMTGLNLLSNASIRFLSQSILAQTDSGLNRFCPISIHLFITRLCGSFILSILRLLYDICPLSAFRIIMPLRWHELYLNKQVSRVIPNLALRHGFRSDEEHSWYTHYFQIGKIMVERLLDNLWSKPEHLCLY